MRKWFLTGKTKAVGVRSSCKKMLVLRIQSFNMTTHCFALDLIDDPLLIAAYEQHHKAVWPAVLESLRSSGIHELSIYRAGNRLFMLMETADDFSPDKKATADAANEQVQQWEQLMWTYQQALPFAHAGEKWVKMEQIFSLQKL